MSNNIEKRYDQFMRVVWNDVIGDRQGAVWRCVILLAAGVADGFDRLERRFQRMEDHGLEVHGHPDFGLDVRVRE